MLFDPDNPVGYETAAAFGLRNELAALAVFQELCEVSSSSEALSHITVGRFDRPTNDGEYFDAAQLAELGFYAMIHRADEERVEQVDGYSQTSSAGLFLVTFRRHVREIEDEQDAFLFFWDRTDKLHNDLAVALSIAECPRLQAGAIVASEGPYFGLHAEEVAQGKYLFTTWSIPWGDNLGD